MSRLLPDNFDDLVKAAIKQFWVSRTSSGIKSQAGGRGPVIAGKNLNGFSNLIKAVAVHCGIPSDCIINDGKKNLSIPGYYRPTKMWDSLVIYKGQLVAAFELKSQVGSFGNNFNNRAEESIGSATDFWIAQREKAFDFANFSKPELYYGNKAQIKPPFLGYLMVLELCDESTSPVKVEEEHFKVFPEFRNTSYAERYKLLCEKLMLEGLYSSAGLILSREKEGKAAGKFSSPAKTLTPKSLFADFAARMLATIETY